ncbi:MAG: hypothetical protein V4642_08945 [Bacteroidota bacterium]
MNNIKSRFERFAAFAFSSASTFDKGAELWDTLSHYEFYLTQNAEPNETFLGKLEEFGCSRRWLLYASGEMFADNEAGKILRYKFINGIGLTNKKLVLAVKSVSARDKESNPATNETVQSGNNGNDEALKEILIKAAPLKNKAVKNTAKKRQKST